MRQRYKSAHCRAASASSSFAKLRSLFSMISSCLSVIGAVATRYKESINESIVFMPSVRSDTHHKMRVRLPDLKQSHSAVARLIMPDDSLHPKKLTAFIGL